MQPKKNSMLNKVHNFPKKITMTVNYQQKLITENKNYPEQHSIKKREEIYNTQKKKQVNPKFLTIKIENFPHRKGEGRSATFRRIS
jgi:hypothetical protein